MKKTRKNTLKIILFFVLFLLNINTLKADEIFEIFSIEYSKPYVENLSSDLNNYAKNLKRNEYEVKDLNKSTKYASTSVNVRTGPSTVFESIKILNTYDSIEITGQASNGWYRTNINGVEAFISNNYVLDSKPEPVKPTEPKKPIDLSTLYVKPIGNVDTQYLLLAENCWQKLPTKLRNFLIDYGTTIYVTDENLAKKYYDGIYTSLAGVTVFAEKAIYLEDRTSAIKPAFIHECAHIIDSATFFTSRGSSFIEIYNEEAHNLLSINGGDNYCLTNSEEFFAESFHEYINSPSKLQSACPKTFAFIDELLISINIK